MGGEEQLVGSGSGARRRTDLLDPVEQLRRRERQQSLVAGLGRSALVGTPLAQLVEDAVAATAEGLDVERVGVLDLTEDGSTLICRSSHGWQPSELRAVPVDAASQVAESFRIRDPVVVADFAADPRFPASRHLVELGLASGVATPIRGDEEPVGMLAAHSTTPDAFGADDVVFLRSVANILAVVTARERAEARRLRSEESLAFLARAGHILAASLDYESTLSALADLVVPRLADWFIVDLEGEDEAMQRVAVAAADPEKRAVLDELAARYTASAGSPQPAGLALGRGGTVRFDELTAESLRETTQDERHFELVTKLDPHAAIAVPLVAHQRTIGALTFAWSESGRRYDEADVALAEELARRAALAIDNARLYRAERTARRAAEEAQRRLSFLAQAGELLSSSLSYASTLQRLAELVVPQLADWCTIVVVADDGSLERLATVHHDPAKLSLAEEFAERYTLDPDAETGASLVVRTGEPTFVPEITDALLVRAAGGDERRLATLRALGLRSAVVVPLIARGRTLGALTLATEAARPPYGEADLRLAEDLARRAAVAVDNARLHAEVERRADAARALRHVADAVVLVDRQGTPRYWNDAADALLDGLAHWPALAPLLEERAREDGAPFAVPVELGGGERWLQVSRVSFAEGRVYALRDVTEERLLERTRSEFVATASHELRTPIAAVYGTFQTLLRPDVALDSPRRLELLRIGLRESERLARVVEDLLLAGQLERGLPAVERAECDVGAVIAEVAESVAAHLGASHRIEVSTEPGLSPAGCEPLRLRQVLSNLLENAVKYSPAGSTVAVSARREDGWTRIEVEDEGIGIPEHDRRRIFERFVRLDPALSRGVGGTGLGLYICRELVARMRGTIAVEGREGGGSRFVVRLPGGRS